MPEEFEEGSSQPFEISRYLDIVRRRHIVFLLLLLVGWAMVWGSSWLLPMKYKSSTQILVEEPALPKNYVVPNISDNLQDRLQSITQQILSRTRLLLIIDKLHLYPNTAHHVLTPDERVDRMRGDIHIELVKDERSDAITAFRIDYIASNPHSAQQVTSELSNLFIDENIKDREQESEKTTQFIESQLANARAALSAQEQKVKEFQSAHGGALPTQEAANLQILSGLQAQLQTEQDALNTGKQQSAYHQSLLQQYQVLGGTHRSANGNMTPTGLEAIDQRLDALRAKLQDLLSTDTDQHPDVLRVKAEIVSTEKEREKMAASLKVGGAKRSETQEITDPVQNETMLQLQSQVQADKLEIENRERATKSLESRIEQYQGLLNSEPGVSQELADLTRGYEQSQTNYNDLLKKESDSRMATSMEQMQEGQRFMILDPPSLPLRPDSPNHLKMCGMGLGAGLGLGGLVVFLLEFLDGRIHSDREIAKLIPVDVIGEIPQIRSTSDIARAKRSAILGWAMAAMVMAVILSGSVFSYLHS